MDEKEQFPADDLPELIFFEPDDTPEEAEFIRVDDLFRLEPEAAEEDRGPFTFVLFPRRAGWFIGSKLALLIRRMMILRSLREDSPMEKIRVRPMFVQWQSDPGEDGQPEAIVREIRTELETQTALLRDTEEDAPFWAGSCFVYRAENEMSDSDLNRLIGSYQEEE